MNKKINKYLAGNVILKDQQQLGPLVLGDCNSALDVGIIKSNRIQTIVSIGLQAQPPKNKLPQNIQHHVFDIHDNKQQKLPVQLLDETFQIIDSGRRKGGVLVHCYAGVSRSSSFVIAYLIRKYLLTYDQAKEKAKKRRPCVHPGDGFVRQLQHYAKVVFRREEERLALLNKKESANDHMAKEEQLEVQKVENQPVKMPNRVKRGVRGGVRSAENFSPQKLKHSGMEKSLFPGKKIEETLEEETKSPMSNKSKQREKTQKVQKLPPIHRGQVESRYQRTSSRTQIKEKIDKIEGRGSLTQAPSIRGIYSSRANMM